MESPERWNHPTSCRLEENHSSCICSCDWCWHHIGQIEEYILAMQFGRRKIVYIATCIRWWPDIAEFFIGINERWLYRCYKLYFFNFVNCGGHRYISRARTKSFLNNWQAHLFEAAFCAMAISNRAIHTVCTRWLPNGNHVIQKRIKTRKFRLCHTLVYQRNMSLMSTPLKHTNQCCPNRIKKFLKAYVSPPYRFALFWLLQYSVEASKLCI